MVNLKQKTVSTLMILLLKHLRYFGYLNIWNVIQLNYRETRQSLAGLSAGDNRGSLN